MGNKAAADILQQRHIEWGDSFASSILSDARHHSLLADRGARASTWSADDARNAAERVLSDARHQSLLADGGARASTWSADHEMDGAERANAQQRPDVAERADRDRTIANTPRAETPKKEVDAAGPPVRVGLLGTFDSPIVWFLRAPFTHEGGKRVVYVLYANDAQPERALAPWLSCAGTCFQWRSVFNMPTAALVQTIRDDKIDLLIDVSGHTNGARFDAFVCRAAPVQATYLGYANTTGLRCVDYRITDALVDPLATRQRFAERLARLPGPFLCYTPPTQLPPVAHTPALHCDYITFASFNNCVKLNDGVLQLWAMLLARLPTARLLIKYTGTHTRQLRQRLVGAMRECSVPGAVDRLVIMPTSPDLEAHYRAYAHVDIALDCWSYSGTTTTLEALLMGVPVVTLKPSYDNHCQMVTTALLAWVEPPERLSDFVAQTPTEYIDKAVRLASDVAALQQDRLRRRDRLLHSRLCDAERFARDWGTLLTELHARPHAPIGQ